MRLQTKHVRTLMSLTRQLDELSSKLKQDGLRWCRAVEEGWSYDETVYARGRLEKTLEKTRLKMGEVYDFMGDRGLREK